MTAQEHKQTGLRHDWSPEEVLELLELPLFELVYQAQGAHRRYFGDNSVQLASLLSIKTGGCCEDCKYCSQSGHHARKTGVRREPMLEVGEVLAKARTAREAGASRFCMGASGRNPNNPKEFARVLEMIRGVRALGMEACVTLGMLTQEQADQLAGAGLNAYNHNLDTSPEFYGEIITTRTYQDRLDTLEIVRKAGITICSGGIIGLGESLFDRARLLQILACLNPHPENVPINALVPIAGTPLENASPPDTLEVVRMIAAARIVMPASRVRLSAGRHNMNREGQILCLMAGANSMFFGERLLTTDGNEAAVDLAMLQDLGMKAA